MSKFIFKMSAKELFRQLVYVYVNARKPLFYHPNIRRGRSHSVSSKVEDLFAYFLSINLTEDYKFYVDQPMSIGKNRLYPDIAVAKDGHVKHIFDIKTDLGWKRDKIVEFCSETQERLKIFENERLSIIDGITKKPTEIDTEKELFYHIIVLSGKNISKEKLDKAIKHVSTLDKVNIYVLFPDVHPNAYVTDIECFIEQVEENEEDFNRLSMLW